MSIDQETRLTISRLLSDLPSETIPSTWIPLLYKGAVEYLREDSDPQSIQILEKAVVGAPVELIRDFALAALKQLALADNLVACDSLYHLAVYSDHMAAQIFIEQNNLPTNCNELRAVFLFLVNQIELYSKLDPQYHLLTQVFSSSSTEMQTRLIESAKFNHKLNWIEIASSTNASTSDQLMDIINHFSHYDDNEQALVRSLFKDRSAHNLSIYQDALCELSVRYDDQVCKNIAIEENYAPQDKVNRAVFFFFSEQWEKYEQEDFNHSLLLTAFENSPSYFRKKIMAHSRQTGYSKWMKGNLGNISRLRVVDDLSDADWQITFRHLYEQKAYQEMWSLAQSAPPIWSSYFLSNIPEDWLPQNESESLFYREIHRLAVNCQKQQLMRPPETKFSSHIDSRSVALSSDGNILAISDSQGEIRFWLMVSGLSYSNIIKSPVPQIRCTAISPDKQYITCANQDHQIRIFKISDGKLVKTCQGHRGLIRSLLFDPSGHTLFSAGFDGTIIAWRFPQGQPKWQHSPNQGEIFCMDLARNGNWIIYGGAGPEVTILQSGDGKPIRKLDQPETRLTLISSSQNGNIAAAYANNERIVVWNLRSGKVIQNISVNGAVLTSLVIHPQEHLIIGSSSLGDILIWSVSNGTLLHRWKAHEDSIIDVKLFQDGNLLTSVSKNGDIAVWKLKTLHLTIQPIGNVDPGVLPKIADYLAVDNLDPIEKNWMEYTQRLLQWKQRFDIEISGPIIIEMKEFDIEI